MSDVLGKAAKHPSYSRINRLDLSHPPSFTMSHITGKRVLVTGGAGFLGREVCAQLASHDPVSLLVPRKVQYDLTEQAVVRRMLDDFRPETVIHLAAVVGGIGANRENPGKFYYENAVMGILLMEEARLRGVTKFVSVGTVSHTRNTRLSRFGKTIFGPGIRKRRTLRTESPKRGYWSRAKRTDNSMVLTRSPCYRSICTVRKIISIRLPAM